MVRRIVLGLAVIVVLLGVVWWFVTRTGSPPTVIEATVPAVQAAGDGEETKAKPESAVPEPSAPTGGATFEEHVAAKKEPPSGTLTGGVSKKKPPFKVMAAPAPPPPPPPPPQQVLMSFKATSEPGASPEPAESPELSPNDAVKQILDSLERARIAFNTPEAMTIGETTTIQLLLSLEHSAEELEKSITSTGAREAHEIGVSDRMLARLTGSGFSITANTPEEQAISSTGTTKWSWDVRPTSPGVQTLHLSLTALIDVGGHGTQHTIDTFDKKIDVNVTWRQHAWSFVTSNWQWLWAALLVPGAGWLWRRRRKVEP